MNFHRHSANPGCGHGKERGRPVRVLSSLSDRSLFECSCNSRTRCPRSNAFQQFTIALLGFWIASIFNSFASPGDVDLSFNPGDRVNDYVYAVAAQADGKLIIGGLFTSPRTLIARLNTNGSVDTNFNVGSGANGIIYSIAVQPDGKIIVVGAFSRINGVSRNRIARLNVDGSLDATFDPGAGADGRIRSVALQSNGRILIAGDFYEVNQTSRVRVARLNFREIACRWVEALSNKQ